ncbi:ABC transporter permease [Aurantimonas endophytica]|uniref:Putative ABC transport system permease protein n=1 Tax=Aurantimonas endophytica TaxID=1522175 RepID=A0A7W6HHR3_9HYPH|nr:ABC transporter permease [Aurantimonas endophytica]MBB4005176.1 putative ABC transport system permease protein [Aurantimonas endophytica]MCO6406161.1 FtsX-like permease family protein [Aurantimonas endophytica]
MSFFRLMRLNAWRRPLRTVLMMLCVAVAFLIHGLGAGFLAGLQGSGGADESRLVVASRSGRAQPLPLSHFARIAADPDVASAAYSARIRGFVETERNVVVASAVDPAAMAAAMGDELGLTTDLLAALAGARDRVLVGRALAETMGWSVGRRVALTPFQTMRADGARTWSFEIAGIFDGARADVDTHFMLARYDYLNAARAGDRDTVDGIVVVPRPGVSPGVLAARIDAMFASSAAPTRTQSEKAFLEALIRQIADFGLIVTLVTSAAFVTILMIVVNTMAFAIRERTFEIGVLKVLGFSPRRVMALVLGETLFVFLVGGLAGLGLAKAGSLLLGAELGLALPPLALAKAVLILLALGLFAGLVPAAQAVRIPIANALKSR